MNNTGHIKARMKSIRQTVQISNAQKMVASSRIGRARRMLEEAEPFHERITRAVAYLLVNCPEVASLYIERPHTRIEKRGLLLITADKGLAGGYSANLVKFTEETLAQQGADHIIVLGHVGRTLMEHAGFAIESEFHFPVEPPSLFAARELADTVMRLFEAGEIDSFDVIYTHFTSTIRLAPTLARLFPLTAEAFGDPPPLKDGVEFEPSPEAVLQMLMPKYIKGFLYGCLVHAWASELASRITAMDNAIRNGNDMLARLSLIYNRERQASITQEITEIVAGALSMKKKTAYLAPPKSQRLERL